MEADDNDGENIKDISTSENLMFVLKAYTKTYGKVLLFFYY